jgi:hypothetical protein
MTQRGFNNTLGIGTFLIIALAITVTVTGIFSTGGPGQFQFRSIRGETVTIYGKGLYAHMSAGVAPQGIAQDYITLFAGIPLLILSSVLTVRNSLRGKYLLAGTLGYFFVTYLFYSVMAMYNAMFLAYVILMSLSFYAFLLVIFSFDVNNLPLLFESTTPVKLIAGFLVFNAIAIALLWLSVIIPPLANGTIIPAQVEHYTTLIVQALDLGILLPGCFISGVLLGKKKPSGYLLAPVYLIFLSILMTALTAKVIAMKMSGTDVFPVIVIIPLINLIAICCAVVVIGKVKTRGYASYKATALPIV